MLQSWKKITKTVCKDKNHRKVRDHCQFTGKHRGDEDFICNLKSNVSNKIHVVFRNKLNYDYYFTVKELVSEL